MSPVAGAVAGHMIGTTQFQASAAPPLPAVHVHKEPVYGQRLAAPPPLTAIHMSPVMGAAAGQVMPIAPAPAAPCAVPAVPCAAPAVPCAAPPDPVKEPA